MKQAVKREGKNGRKASINQRITCPLLVYKNWQYFFQNPDFFSGKKQGIGIFSECKNAVENEKLFKIWILTKHMSGETEMKKKDPKPY